MAVATLPDIGAWPHCGVPDSVGDLGCRALRSRASCFPVPAVPSSAIPVVLAKLGPLHPHDTGRLRAHLQRVPDACVGTGESKIPATMSEMWCSPTTPPPSTPAARRGRWPYLRNLAIGRLRLLGADNIAETTRAIRDTPEHALWIWGHHRQPTPTGNLKPPARGRAAQRQGGHLLGDPLSDGVRAVPERRGRQQQARIRNHAPHRSRVLLLRRRRGLLHQPVVGALPLTGGRAEGRTQ